MLYYKKCYSESRLCRNEEYQLISKLNAEFFTPLRYVQNDKNNSSKFIFCLLLIFSILLITSAVNAQFKNNGNLQIVVKGLITDEFTGDPVETTITIKDKSGKKFKIKSNSVDGSYQQVLSSGETYEFTFLNFDVLKKVETLYVEPAQKYTEQKADFTVKKLRQGTHLYSSDIFNPGSSEIIDSLKAVFKELEEILVYNRSAKFVFITNSHDTYASVPKISDDSKSTKGKKTKQKAKSKLIASKLSYNPDSNLVKALVDRRMKSVMELTEGFMKRNRHRFSYSPDYSLSKSNSDASALARNPDFIIAVSEIKNAFE